MRILLVNSIPPDVWGGGEKWFVEAAQWFAERGHEPLVVGRPGGRLLAATRERGLAQRSFDFGGDYDPFATVRATAILTAHRSDVVLTNFNKEAWLFGRGASLLRRPLVVRHGLTVLRPKQVHRFLVRFHVRRIVVNARSIRDEYTALGYDGAKIEYIPNGVRFVDAAPQGAWRARLGIDAEAPLIVGGGRMDGQKRLDRFVEICARIARHHAEARFVLVGEGNERDALVARIAALGLTDRMVLPGFVDDLARVIGDADLFLLTSRAEGTPNVLLEAMAAGTTCLAFDVGAVPEILYGDLATCRCAEGDVETMGARALELLASPVENARIAALQRERVRAEFSQEVSMQRYLDLFVGLRG